MCGGPGNKKLVSDVVSYLVGADAFVEISCCWVKTLV